MFFSGQGTPNPLAQLVFVMNKRCRPGPHSAPCGPAPKGPYSDEYCNCGCSASDWCAAQGVPVVNKKNWKKHSERLWALFLMSFTTIMDPDDAIEFGDLKQGVADYVKRTTHG
jgi:hypothetical protein